MNRRIVLAGIAVLAIGSAPAWAQSRWKPTQTVEIICHSTASGQVASDMIAIMAKNNLTDAVFQVSVKSGGGATAAINHIVEKTGDAHTIGIGSNTWITGNLLQQEAKYGLLDLTQVGVIGEDPFVALVRADSEYKTFEDFVAAAKANPGALNQSGGSVPGHDNLVSLAVMKAAGSKWNYVSFPSRGERAAALLGGHVQLYMTDPVESIDMVRSGRLRALALLSPTRLEDFPDVPTISEIYPQIKHVPLARFVAGTPQMPPEAVAYYEELFRKVTETDDWKDYAKKNGMVGSWLGTTEAVAFLTTLRDQIRGLASDAGHKVIR